MQASLSRSTSTATGGGAVFGDGVIISLDTLEEMQDRWIRKTETARQPNIPAPQLNSPRSLHICAQARIDPLHDLQKLSLRQHLTRVMGNATLTARLTAEADGADAHAMTFSAQQAMRQSGLWMGTAAERLAAYRAYQRQERHRVPLLATLKALRRQEIIHNYDGTSFEAQTPQGEHATPQRGDGSNDNSDCAFNGRVALHHASSPSTTPAMVGRTVSVSAHSPAGSARSDGISWMTTSASRAGLPYKPRDAAALASSVFANRVITTPVSDPAGVISPRRGVAVMGGQDSTTPQPREELATESKSAEDSFSVERVPFLIRTTDFSLASADGAGVGGQTEFAWVLQQERPSVGAVRLPSTGHWQAEANVATPPPITDAEQRDGYFYYCANVTAV